MAAVAIESPYGPAMLNCQFCDRPVDVDGPDCVTRTKKVFRAGTMPDVSRIVFCSETCAQHHDQGDEKPEPIVVPVRRKTAEEMAAVAGEKLRVLAQEPEPVEQASGTQNEGVGAPVEQSEKKRHNWSPEARAAAAERMRERNRLKAESKRREAEGIPEPADVRERRLAMEEGQREGADLAAAQGWPVPEPVAPSPPPAPRRTHHGMEPEDVEAVLRLLIARSLEAGGPSHLDIAVGSALLHYYGDDDVNGYVTGLFRQLCRLAEEAGQFACPFKIRMRYDAPDGRWSKGEVAEVVRDDYFGFVMRFPPAQSLGLSQMLNLAPLTEFNRDFGISLLVSYNGPVEEVAA